MSGIIPGWGAIRCGLAAGACLGLALAPAALAVEQAGAFQTGGPAQAISIGSMVSLGLLILGAAVWLWVGALVGRRGWSLVESVRARDLDHARAPGPFVPGAVMVLIGLAVWLIQPMGAAAAHALARAVAPAVQGAAEPALRSGVIAQLGAHAAALLVIATIVAWMPGAWRAMGATLGGQAEHPVPAGGAGREILRTVRLAFIWTLMVGPAVYVIGSLSLWAARALAAWSGRTPPGDVAHDTLSKLASPQPEAPGVWWWATVVGVTVGAPIVEEFIYRGLIQTGLMRLTRSTPVAVIGTSLPFALAHAGAVESHALLTLFVLSLGFGLALEKTGRLWVCVLMHAAFNGANVALAMVR